MRVLVCGGRDFGDTFIARHILHSPLAQQKYKEFHFTRNTLGALLSDYYDNLTIIAGGARGVDKSAEQWAFNVGVKAEIYPADWNKHGKRAGYIRNQQMLDEGKPDLVIAFPGGRGTAMMVDIARKAGVEVKEITYDGNEEDCN